MNKSFQLALYLVLGLSAVAFGIGAFRSYTRLMTATPESSPAALDVPAVERTGENIASQGYARVMIFGGAFFISVVALGFLLGHDLTHHLGNRVLKGLYNDEGEGLINPEYEQAEQVWADGDHLEAIRLMREYLNKNPREQHVAIRIAEIYERDLHNNLAAALEYEEILKQRLAPERWGWSAIHLCNLYFRLNQPEKAFAWLRRIDAEYGETAAAEKARQRLALYDAGEAEEASAEPTPVDEKPGS